MPPHRHIWRTFYEETAVADQIGDTVSTVNGMRCVTCPKALSQSQVEEIVNAMQRLADADADVNHVESPTRTSTG